MRLCVFFAAQLVTEALEAREGGAKDTDRGPQTGDSGVSTLTQLRAFFDTHQMIVECSTILGFAFCLPNHTALSGLQPTCATQRFFRTTMRTYSARPWGGRLPNERLRSAVLKSILDFAFEILSQHQASHTRYMGCLVASPDFLAVF